MQQFRDGVGWLRMYVSLVSFLFRDVCDPQMFDKIPIFFYITSIHIRQSVDCLCRDGPDMQYMQHLRKFRITLLQITFKVL